MIDELELKELVENFKFKNDGVYDCFEYLLDSERVQDPDAITLIKFAIEHEIEALSEEEMRIIGIDILKTMLLFSSVTSARKASALKT
jgi:hypothetical protein